MNSRPTRAASSSLDQGGEPPDHEVMEARVKKLEEIAEETAKRLVSLEQDVTAIKQDIAVIKSTMTHYATKADVSDAKASIIMWVVSAVLLAQVLPMLLRKFGLG